MPRDGDDAGRCARVRGGVPLTRRHSSPRARDAAALVAAFLAVASCSRGAPSRPWDERPSVAGDVVGPVASAPPARPVSPDAAPTRTDLPDETDDPCACGSCEPVDPIVPRVPGDLTPETAEDAIGAIRVALILTTGKDWHGCSLATFAAISAFETGRWQAMREWNFGNTNHTRTDGRPYYVRGEARMQAFESLDDGARHWVRVVAIGYPEAVRAAHDCAPERVARALKAAGYYTAPESIYAAGLLGLSRELAGGS